MRPGRSIHIVDDDDALRDSLSFLMQSHGLQSVLYETGNAFLGQDLNNIFAPILLDIRMPGKNGAEVLQDALTINPNLQIIMMSGHADIATAVSCVKMGALDFLEKPFRDSQILPLIEQAQAFINQNIKENLEQQNYREILNKLTPREAEVLACLADGKTNKAIAFDLGLSVRTVETHRAHLMSKLNAASLSDVIKLYLKSQSS